MFVPVFVCENVEPYEAPSWSHHGARALRGDHVPARESEQQYILVDRAVHQTINVPRMRSKANFA